jgi:uncharacterized protein YcgI (DUF1989 family)
MIALIAVGCWKSVYRNLATYVEFEALMDCLFAFSNCPFTGGTPMKVEIFEGEAG